MRRRLSLPLALVVAGLFAASCGGTTGLEIRVDLPPAWVAGVDFNNLLVQVSPDDGGTAGETYPVSALTPKPYIVYAFEGKTPHDMVSVHVEAQLTNSTGMTVKAAQTLANVTLKQGAIKYLVADLSHAT